MESNGDVGEQKSSCTQNRLRKEPLFGAIYMVAVAALPLPGTLSTLSLVQSLSRASGIQKQIKSYSPRVYNSMDYALKKDPALL